MKFMQARAPIFYAQVTFHCSDVTWASCHPKLPTTRLLVELLVQSDKKKRTACALFILCKGIHQFPVDSLHKGPVVQKLFQCHLVSMHDDVIKWKHFPRYWPFVRGIHRSPVNSPHKGQWCGDLMFRLFCAWINGWANNREAGDLRRHRAHYGVIVMALQCHTIQQRIIVLITWPT